LEFRAEVPMKVSLQGFLESFLLPDVLSFLNVSRKTGTLEIRKQENETRIYFDAGALVYAASNQEKFWLSSIILLRKKIDPDRYKRIVSAMRKTDKKFGHLALEEGVLTETEVMNFLKIQISEIVYDCFAWCEGEFWFTDQLELPEHAV